MINKGLVSYRDPESAPGRGQKTLNVTRDMDLTKVRNRPRSNFTNSVQGVSFKRLGCFINQDILQKNTKMVLLFGAYTLRTELVELDLVSLFYMYDNPTFICCSKFYKSSEL